IFPVTVGLPFVLCIIGSISLSIKLFKAHEPAIMNADPTKVKITISRDWRKCFSVNINANHKPVKVVIKFEFTIPILINAVKSLQVVFAGLDVSSIVVIVRLFPIQPLLSSKYLLQSLL